jgi:phage gpG-like protein
MDLKFDFSDVHKMARQYANGPQIVRDETRVAITRSVITVANDAKKLVPVDTGRLRSSLTHEVTTSGNAVTGRAGTNVDYAKIVEEGRSPGKMPPPGALLGWMSRHGIDERFEFVVARSINRRKRPRPYLKPALEKNRTAITREMGQALRRIGNRLAGLR